MFSLCLKKLPKNSVALRNDSFRTNNYKTYFGSQQRFRFENNFKKTTEGKVVPSTDGNNNTEQQFPFSPVTISKKAAQLMEANAYEEAIAEYLKLISMVPASPAAFLALGICYLALGNIAEAESYVERALAINDEFVPAIIEKAKIYIKTANLVQANIFLEKAIRIQPENIEARLLLCANYIFLSNFAKAEEVYRQILTIDSNNREAHAVFSDFGLVNIFISIYQQLNPLVQICFPKLDFPISSHHAFLVQYQPHQQKDLGLHVDDSSFTINLCLENTDPEQGELFFKEYNSNPEIKVKNIPELGDAVLHYGNHMHGAYPISEGRRFNLIIWYRGNSYANQ